MNEREQEIVNEMGALAFKFIEENPRYIRAIASACLSILGVILRRCDENSKDSLKKSMIKLANEEFPTQKAFNQK